MSVVFPESIRAEIPMLRMYSNALCSAYLAYETICATFSCKHKTQTYEQNVTSNYLKINVKVYNYQSIQPFIVNYAYYSDMFRFNQVIIRLS